MNENNVEFCRYKDVCGKACNCERTCSIKDEKTCDLEIAFCNTFDDRKKNEVVYNELCF